MNAFELTRALVDIESVTPNEEQVGNFLFDYLSRLAASTGGQVERMPVEPHRFNVFARWGDPVVTLSTHIDTVPPFFASREDEEFIWGRGSCDTKGIIASMIFAIRKLLDDGVRNIAMLFVVGEERNSAGALAAAKDPRGSKFLINGEPTENKLALGSKGALRYEIDSPRPHGPFRLSRARRIRHRKASRCSGAPAPHAPARAIPCSVPAPSTSGPFKAAARPTSSPIMRRPKCSSDSSTTAHPPAPPCRRTINGQADLREILCMPALKFGALDGFETSVVSYTTDIPAFGTTWGRPFLFGPGSIHVAHTAEERIAKRDIEAAIQIYQNLVRQLLNS